MSTCKHSIQINAPIEQVWNILTDFDGYPDWNPLVGNIKGTVVEQNYVLIYLVPLKMYVPVQISHFEAPYKLIWTARVPFPTVLEGVHFYQLKPIDEQQTLLVHGEFFNGLIGKNLPVFIISKLQDAYQYHNEKLKIIAENRFLSKS